MAKARGSGNDVRLLPDQALKWTHIGAVGKDGFGERPFRCAQVISEHAFEHRP